MNSRVISGHRSACSGRTRNFTTELAKAFVARMRELWTGSGGQVSSDQRAQILETVESREY
ncbi:MAG: hypothetical protein ACXVXC_00515 [Nocardioidaceae bacterium]